MQQLPLKIMINSYCRYQQQNTFIQDCLNAITNSIKTVDHKVLDSIKQIKQTLCLASDPSENQMSVIMEEETQRSDSQKLTYSRWMEKVTEEFNHQIGRLNRVDINVEKLLDIYKSQLKNLSKYVMKWQHKNEELKKENLKLAEENNQLKDQFARESAQIFMNENEQIESVFDVRSRNTGKFGNAEQKQELPKFKIKNTDKDKKSENKKSMQRKSALEQFLKQQKQTRINPKFNSESVQFRKLQKEPTSIQVTIRDKQVQEDNQKWKKLSKKIEELKGKLVVYQEQIEQKNQQITKLKNTLKQLKMGESVEQQQKKKLKTANTNLRGQKTVMQNQLASIKKLLVEKTELCSIQESQIIQLKTQIQNLTQTIKFQTSNINQLRQSVAKQSGKQVFEYRSKIQKLTNFNEELVKFIGVQERQYQELNKKCQQIEQLLQLKMKSMMGKVTELQMILDEKNQCIVRMKSKGYGNQNANPNITGTGNGNTNTTYLNQLVRVLTKKVADRDEIIRKFEQTR